MKKPIDQNKKIQTSLALYAQCMADPSAFRRRTFRKLPQILSDIEVIRDKLGLMLGSQRQADVWSPLLAAAWSAVSDEPLASVAGLLWIETIFAGILEKTEENDDDEDRVIGHILSAHVMNDDKKQRTIAELLVQAAEYIVKKDPGYEQAAAQLSRIGIKLRILPAESITTLFIATRSDHLAKLLQDTPYGSSYDAQIKRNELCLNPENGGLQEYFKCGRKKARRIDWEKFKAKYMGGEAVDAT